jgi:hypothetical protein
MKRWILSFALAIILPAAAHAHHSLAGVYDSSKEVTIEGAVSEFQFINPHPFLIVAVKTSDGVSRQWKLEMDNRFELIDIGMTNQTLKPGDKVVVTGSLIRPPQSQGLYIRKLERPADGFQYEQIGTSPRIRLPQR